MMWTGGRGNTVNRGRAGRERKDVPWKIKKSRRPRGPARSPSRRPLARSDFIPGSERVRSFPVSPQRAAPGPSISRSDFIEIYPRGVQPQEDPFGPGPSSVLDPSNSALERNQRPRSRSPVVPPPRVLSREEAAEFSDSDPTFESPKSDDSTQTWESSEKSALSNASPEH